MTEVTDWCDLFFIDFPPPPAGELIGKKMDVASRLAALRRVIALLESFAPSAWHADSLEEPLRHLADELDLKPGQLFGIVRVAVTGKSVAPPLFGTLGELGRDKSLARLRAAEGQLAQAAV
jgi:glutamyl-tRNA synthetase